MSTIVEEVGDDGLEEDAEEGGEPTKEDFKKEAEAERESKGHETFLMREFLLLFCESTLGQTALQKQNKQRPNGQRR